MSPLIALRRSDIVSLLLLFLAVILLGAPLAIAQKDAGAIVGTVHDPTGAVVVGAKVSVTDFERGQTFATTTSSSGEYVASPLRIGRYTVTVEHPGFKTAVSNTVEINVQDRAAVNITLQLGSTVDKIEVEATTPLIETETSELGQVVDSKRVSTLPLNGRNFAQLALLSAGTAPSEPGSRDEGGFGFSSNGARSLQNNFLLDGVDNNSNLPDLLNETNFVIQPPIDALEEFKVQTNAYSAEFGRGNGAIVNAVIKSGKNQLHGSLWEFLRNEKLDSKNYFDDRNAPTPPFKQNQFGGTFGGPVVIPGLYNGKDRTFFFFDYEGLRKRQAQTQTALVPNSDWLKGDFTNGLDGNPLLDYTKATHLKPDGTGPLISDCNGVQTYAGEIFDTRQTQVSASSPTGLCGMPFGYNAGGQPINVIPLAAQDPLAQRLAALYPAAGPFNNGNNFLANPVLKESRTNFDARVDQKFSDADSIFFRFSYEDQPSTIPGTFPGVADGGGFFSGVEENSYRSFATSWTHIFTPTLINEFRLGYNRINSQRAQLNADKNISGDPAFNVNFPGVPFSAGIGGLPQLGFSDVATLGSPTYLPSKEIQNSYTLSENLTWVKGHNTFKYGTEIRREEFTIFQPASPRGNLSFSPQFTDNPASVTIGTGGTGFASFLLGLTDGGSINNLHNVDYFRQTYAFYGQDDWKVSPKLTLNLGLRYELFLPVTERHDQLANFDLTHPSTPTLIVPKGQTQQLTPFIGASVAVRATGNKSLINTDLNNLAPRIGLAYQVAGKTVLRAGYGIFYGGQESGPYSNPSPGFNPPFFVTQSFSAPCSSPSANPSLGPQNCSVPNFGVLANGFPANSLVDPNTPTFFSVDQNLRTPYMQQWHFGVQQELPWNSVFELTYAGSKGTKLYTFFNGNQAQPVDPLVDPRPTAARRPVQSGCDNLGNNCNPVFDTGIDWFRSTGKSSYNSLQAHYEKRFSRGLQFQASYTWAHSLDISSNANLGPTQNNSDFRDFRFPGAELGNSDFDVRHRLVLSSSYELPFGHGKHFLGDASGIANQIAGGWQIANILSISTGNWYTVLDANGNFANADGNAGGVSQRPDQISDPTKAGPVMANPDPNCHTTVSQGGIAPDRVGTPSAYFNTCAFTDPPAGFFGNVGRNTIQGPGSKIWDFSVFKIFSIEERAHLEFRAEFFNILNHTNFLFAKSGPQNGNGSTILGASQFGFLTAARDPRQVQFALKLSF